MKRIISIILGLLLTFTFATTVFAQQPPQDILLVTLKIQNGQVTLVSIDKTKGYLPDNLKNLPASHKLIVYGQNEEELYTREFNFPTTIIGESITPEGTETGVIITKEEVNTTVGIPVFENAQKLAVFDSAGNQLLEHKLEIIVNPNLPQTEKATGGLPAVSIIGTVIIVLVVIGLVIFWFLKRRSSE